MNRAQGLRNIIEEAETELAEIERNCEHDPKKVSEAKTSDGRRHIGMRCKKCGLEWGEHPDGLFPEPLPEHLLPETAFTQSFIARSIIAICIAIGIGLGWYFLT